MVQDPIKKLDEADPLSKYASFVYRVLGRKLLQNDNFRKFFYKKIYQEKYETVLLKANMRVMPEEYFSTIFITITGIGSLIILLSIVMLFFEHIYALYAYMAAVGLMVFGGFNLYNYPISISKKRGAEIDAAIPYLLPYMKILSTEVNLSKMLSIIDGFLIYKEIRAEFRKIKYYADFLGHDIHTSIRKAMESCPSRKLSDIMNDLATITSSGGDVYNYLVRKVNAEDKELQSIENKNIDTLLILSQVYVILLLIAPLFFTIMTSILSLIAMGDEGGGDNVGTIMGLLFGLPFLYIGFMLVIYYSKPLYARLPVDEEENEQQ